MIKGNFRIYCGFRAKGNIEVIRATQEARICLNCTLPAKECKPLSCKRYKEEKRKIKNERI